MDRRRIALKFILAATLGGCATVSSSQSGEAGAHWAANGWLNPGMTDEPEVIGLFATRGACEAAVKEWMSRQVVGNPVHGECLPIDRH
ncbi:MAG TPA: hypothetical protein VNH64_09430 [Parvularculaceae bacterium]|nr:hypothetical protein [Parvularculaceae bacterium]